MKKTVLIIAALFAGLSLRAQEEPSYSATVDFSYATTYVFRGVELAKGTLMPSVEFGSGNFAAGIWSAQPVTDNLDNEIDFYAGYSGAISETWGFDVGACVYYYPELDTGGGADEVTWEPYIGISGDLGGFAPGVYLYYDLTLKVLTAEGQLGYSIPLESAGSSLDFAASIGRVDPKSGSGYTYYNLGMSVPFQLSDSGTLSLGVDYAHNNISGADNSHFFGTIGVSIGF